MTQAAQHARINKVPFLGICLGSQIMAIEFARNVLGIVDASSEEFTPDGEHNIVHIMEDQKHLNSK
jgi:CTP synthase